MSELKFYDFRKKWHKKCVPHLQDKELQRVLNDNFGLYVKTRANHYKYTSKFIPGTLPATHDSCDWRFGHRGKEPGYWGYVCHGACHWLVNFALRLAQLAEPNEKWRIVTSDTHSTVWNGKDIIFDLQYLALGVDPNEAFDLEDEHTMVLEVGEYLEPSKPQLK